MNKTTLVVCEDGAAADCAVGFRLWFDYEVRPYRIRARGDRYLVTTKPMNVRRTVLYCVVDLKERVRGTEDLIFGMGAETDEQCAEMLARLESGVSEVSHRNRVPLRVVRIEGPAPAKHTRHLAGVHYEQMPNCKP